MNPLTEPEAERWIEDVDTIKVMADERRLAMLRLMADPTTVKEVSDALDIPPSKLYYHVNLLEKHGLIRVVDHNIDSGIVEKIYQVTARQFKLINPLLCTDLPQDTAVALLTSTLDETKHNFLQAYAAQPKDTQTPPRHPFLSRKSFQLTEAQLTQLHAKLAALMEEAAALGAANAGTDSPIYDLTLVFFKHSQENVSPHENEHDHDPNPNHDR